MTPVAKHEQISGERIKVHGLLHQHRQTLRTAINTPIQGTAADLIKIAMIHADAALLKKRLKSAMILTVHDELVFEVAQSETRQVSELLQDALSGIL